jgi:hypothetical protein
MSPERFVRPFGDQLITAFLPVEHEFVGLFLFAMT